MIPQLSVIVPTRDRAEGLEALLGSLARHGSVGFPWEVIVVDNGRGDETRAVCRRHAHSLGDGGALKYVVEPTPGLHRGRHRGAQEASAEVLVFVDDDVEVSATWLPALRDAFAHRGVELMGGPSLPHFDGEPPAWIAATWIEEGDGTRWCGYLSLLESGHSLHEIDPIFVWGLNFAIRRDTLWRLKGFHPDAVPWELRRYRGDGETGLSLKAKAAGIRAWYCPGALVYHAAPAARLTEAYFARRSFLQGISDSFTATRARGGPVAPTALSRAQRLRSWLRGVADPRIPPRRDDPYAALRDRLTAAYTHGYAFHQRELASDPALLTWVLRDDYLDAVIPRL